MRSVLPPDHPVRTHHELALALGGDATSFTGDLLRLIEKADLGNRYRLRLGFPGHVAAWEAWMAAGSAALTSAAIEAVANAAESA